MILDYIKKRGILDTNAEKIAKEELYNFFKTIIEVAKVKGDFRIVEQNRTLLQVRYGTRSNAKARDYKYISITLLPNKAYSNIQIVDMSDKSILKALIEAIEANLPECGVRGIFKAKKRANSCAISIRLGEGLAKLVTEV